MKLNLSLCTTWSYIAKGSGVMVPFNLNLGTRWRWAVNFTLRLLYPRKEPRYPMNRGLDGPRSRCGHFREQEDDKFCEKYKLLGILLCSFLQIYPSLSSIGSLQMWLVIVPRWMCLALAISWTLPLMSVDLLPLVAVVMAVDLLPSMSIDLSIWRAKFLLTIFVSLWI